MAEKHIKIKAKKHARKHGFLNRMKTRTGQNVIKRRRNKGRKNV